LRNIRTSLEQILIRRYGVQFYYGHREIIFNEAGLEADNLLIGILQHGIGPTFTLHSDWPTPRHFDLQRTPLWVFSKTNETDLRNLGVKNVKAIGSPWLYQLKNAVKKDSESKNASRDYCLVFPSHTHFMYIEKTTIEEISIRIKFWKKLAKNDRIIICLYWVDFLDQRWQKAARLEDVELTCVGVGATDPIWSKSPSRLEYYSNLHKLIEGSIYCIFEGFTSAIFYASSLKKPFGIFSTDFEERKIEANAGFSKEHSWLLFNARANLKDINANEAFSEKSMDLLGYDQIRSKDELLMILEWKQMKILSI
jgi:hypothetical protein